MSAKSAADLTTENNDIIVNANTVESITETNLGQLIQDLIDSAYNNVDTPLNLNTVTSGTLTIAIKVTQSLTFGAVGAQLNQDVTFAVVGAVLGDSVSLGVPAANVPSGACSFFAFVASAGNVTVRFINASAGSLTPGTGTFTITIIK